MTMKIIFKSYDKYSSLYNCINFNSKIKYKGKINSLTFKLSSVYSSLLLEN